LEIVVQLNRSAAAELSDEQGASPRQRQLVPELEDLALSLDPMHPGAGDPALSSYFTVEVPDAEAERAVETLQRSDAVEAAYMKPAAEPP
jgi:hypothetical protein